MEKTKNKLEVTLPSDKEILQIRVFNAPRELVFKAFTDPDLIPKWWGPRNTITVVDKMDVRPGGPWRFIQRDQDGTEHAFNGVYREVTPAEKIVDTFEYEPWAGHGSVENITFEEIDGRTRMTNLSAFDSKEDRDGMLQAGMEEGAAETLDRFEEVLAGLREDYL
ncbi:MAG: SRPBCC family protein [Anaerolineales bacterium]